jgi:hypothetical protein
MKAKQASLRMECGKMMFGWESNKTLLRKYLVDHAEDIGRFYAEILMNSPKIYADFAKGFMEEVYKQNKKE